LSDQPVAWRDDTFDTDLLAAAHGGDATASKTLHARHGPAALAVARQYARSDADAAALATAALEQVDASVRAGAGPEVAYRLYLLATVRRLALGERSPDAGWPAGGGAASSSGAELGTGHSGAVPGAGLVDPGAGPAAAFASLPERWQAVLWYAEVERLSAEETASHLGLSTAEVAALARLARQHLREAFLRPHVDTATTAECHEARALLPAHLAGELGRRDTARVRDHLEGCAGCRAAAEAMESSEHDLRGVVGPLVLGAAGLAVLDHALPLGALVAVEAPVASGDEPMANGAVEAGAAPRADGAVGAVTPDAGSGVEGALAAGAEGADGEPAEGRGPGTG
jgi:DNA-directed RNA polymerase specialized sigma24 family protein